MAILRKTFFGLVAVMALLSQSMVLAQDAIGVAAIVENDVSGVGNQGSRTIHVRDRIYFNETIKTGSESRTQVIFQDETVLNLGPNSELLIDSMVYDPATEAGELAVEAVSGVFRFVSGHMSKENYSIRTPVTQIGIRGTTLDLLVEPGGATSVIVVEGAVEVTGISSGISEIVPKGQSTTVDTTGTAPSKAAPPPPAMVQRAQTILPQGGGGTGPLLIPGGVGPNLAGGGPVIGGDVFDNDVNVEDTIDQEQAAEAAQQEETTQQSQQSDSYNPLYATD